jgi:hypothetical protein
VTAQDINILFTNHKTLSRDAKRKEEKRPQDGNAQAQEKT